jgi:RimJ/RimL family protein N-acetyltransferase
VPKRAVPTIEGRRVRLRPLVRTDLELTLAWRNRDDSRRWFLNAVPIAWEQHLAWFERYAERDDDFLFVVEDLEQGGRSVGQVALYGIDWEGRTAEFGRLLIGEPSGRGRGLGRKVTASIIAFGFRSWDLERIGLEVLRDNDRAIRIYRSLGFQVVAGGEVPLRMSMTKSTWESRGHDSEVRDDPGHDGYEEGPAER